MMAIFRRILCDSCGQPASPEHVRERLARLELITRYRPIHIGLLLVCTSPPVSLLDDLYAWEQQAAGPKARDYLQGLLQCFTSEGGSSPGGQLSDLQRRGVFLSRLVECPINLNLSASDSKNENLATLYGPVLIKRIQFSYKPRQIALLAPVAPGLADLLRKAGFGPQLIAEGQGIEIPAAGDVAGVAHIRALLSLSDAASA
jgi:hypothetical protein